MDLADEDLFRSLRGASPAETERIHALLVARHAGLVGWLASCYARRGVDLEELRQVGYVGLMLAINRFDPERGGSFTSFARPTVRGEIQRYFRDKRRCIRLPRRVAELKAEIEGAREPLTQTLARQPTVPEFARLLGVGQDAVREALAADYTLELRSLDEPVGQDGGLVLADVLGCPDPRLELVEDYHALGGLLSALPERERHILRLYFFADSTQAQIGEHFGLSQMHVSRLLRTILDGLREQMLAVA